MEVGARGRKCLEKLEKAFRSIMQPVMFYIPFFAVINVFQEFVFDWIAFEFQACVWWEECIAVILHCRE